jgi:DNA polymerase-3 subunit beta
MTIKCGRKTRKLPLQHSEEFPNFEGSLGSEVFQELTFDSDTSNLFNLLKTFISFASTDETKGVLNCIHVEGDRIAATDGHRAVRSQTDLIFDNPINIHYKVAKEMVKLSGEITLTISKTFIKAETQDITYTGRLVNGDYPLVNQLFPNEFLNTLTLTDPKSLSMSVTALTAFTDNKNHLLKLADKDGEVFIGGESDITEGSDLVECETNSTGFNLGFNSTYLKAALAVQKGLTTIKFNNSRSPVIITSVGVVEALVMPFRKVSAG